MEIIRTFYLNKLEKWLNIKDIKIITGLRRIGKSTLMEQFKLFLKNEKGVNINQIIDKYNFNDIEILSKTTWTSLINDIRNIVSKNKNIKHYLFIDEIQELKDWQKAIKTLFEDKNLDLDIYLTGSNSETLSTDLGTWFTGRHLNVSMYPFTFKEIIKNNVLNADINSTLKQYLYYGGIGKVIPNYKNIENVKLLLKVVNEDSIQKDIFKRYRIKNKTEFLSIVKYIFDQVGKNISINNIATDFYQSKKIKYSYKTIADYLYKLENANLIISLPYYDLKGRKIIKSKQKYYSSDLGLLSINTTFQGNKSWRLENLVFLELLQRYDEVYTYTTSSNKEIDFLCIKNEQITYYQVTDYLFEKDEPNSNWEREVGNLASIRNSWEKIVLATNVDSQILSNGIKIINLAEWLLE